MKFLKLILFGLICLQFVSAQTQTEKLQFIGDFNFNNSYEKIADYKLTESGKLVLVNADNYLVWDIKTKKVIKKNHHGAYFASGADTGVFSPDKKRVLTLSRQYTERDALDKKIKKHTNAELWNVETGEKLAVFDKLERPLLGGAWSDDGLVLVTSIELETDKNAVQTAADKKKLDETVTQNKISFWDGLNGKLRSEITVKNLVWRYLSADGSRLLTASGPKKEFIGIDYASDKAATIDVWNTMTGQIEKSFVVGDDVFFTRTFKLRVSPNGKLLALVQKSRQKDSEDRLLVFNIEAGTSPVLVIKANPQIADSEIAYTPDSKYVALDSGKNTQIYSLENGAKMVEILNYDPPDFWFVDNTIAVYNGLGRVTGVRVANSALSFVRDVPYATQTVGTGSYTTDSNGNTTESTETIVVDSTKVVPNPNNSLFLEHSNKYATVCDAQTGQVVQRLVQPKQIVKRKLKILGIPVGSYIDDGERTVASADWSPDGRYAVVRNYNGRSLSIWEINN